MNSAQERKLAVVTGASSGIGFELAKVFVAEGFDLLIAAEDAELTTALEELKGASKSFALAIRNELKDTGVTVTALMPGPTDTEFFERAGMEDTKVGADEKDDPAEVARQGYEALMAGKEKVVGGSFKNKVQTVAGKVIPDSKKAEMHRQMAEPGSSKED
jgi:short-subunit dehydrogenase